MSKLFLGASVQKNDKIAVKKQLCKTAALLFIYLSLSLIVVVAALVLWIRTPPAVQCCVNSAALMRSGTADPVGQREWPLSLNPQCLRLREAPSLFVAERLNNTPQPTSEVGNHLDHEELFAV